MLTSYLPIGHRPSDNERQRKLKSIFALVMIGCVLLTLDYMLLRQRSSLELGLDLFLLAASCWRRFSVPWRPCR